MDKQIRMMEFDQRLETFKKWPFTTSEGATCTAEKLAEVGFFCPNPDKDPDSLKCFLCQKELDGWEPMDSPFKEHKSHSPDCKFEKLCKSIEDMTVEDYLDVIAKANVINTVDAARRQYLKSFDSLTNKEKEWTSYKAELDREARDTQFSL